MKSVHDKYVTKEARQNLVSVGKPFKQEEKYTKSDFLTPGMVAKKFQISTENAKKIMQKFYKEQTSFVLNGRRASVIVTLGQSHSFYLHPMAIEVFQNTLNKQKD